jgi:3-deoxy-7-phosphoheptulonate synthase
VSNTVVSGRDPVLPGAVVNAHVLPGTLRFPKGRAPWLTARQSVFDTLTRKRSPKRRRPMILELDKDLTVEGKTELIRKLRAKRCDCRELPPTDVERIGILGKPGVDEEELKRFPGVAAVIRVKTPYKLVGRDMHPQDTQVRIGDVTIGGENIAVVAGPCAVESLEQALTIAREVKKAGAALFRGGAFKPRTSPYSFQGMEENGLKILAEVRETLGIRVVTEMTSPSQADLMMKYIDVVQVGARNMQNFELLKCVGRMGKPVLLKRGLSGTLEEWLMSAEYILAEGNAQVILCERGIRTFEPYTRNTLDLSAIPVLKKLTHLPIIVDPSHATGMREKVSPMARSAIAAGADGLMIEVHHDPDHALSDGAQSLYPHQFRRLMRDIYVIAPVIGKQLDFAHLERVQVIERKRRAGSARQRAAFVGRVGTFSHKACLQYFGTAAEAVPLPTFQSIFEAVKAGRVDYGIVPIENSLSGSIHENFDLLREFDLRIIGDVTIRIMQNLLAKPGTDIAAIRRVLSHPQGFEQCRQFLAQHQWEHVAVGDTAGAAERVSASAESGEAAIANLAAAEHFGLVALAEGIEDNPRNFTRFVVIGREPIEDRKAAKTSLICSARNEPGALFAILRVFADNQVNMTKLESRPIPGEPWRYMFYIDLEADLEAPEMAALLAAIAERCDYFKILGCY